MFTLGLKNFRQHSDINFSFPSSGLVLLNGKSGGGKSTIMNSILFCVTGKGTGLQHHNLKKKNTSVYIEIDGVKITRSKIPNRLVVVKDGIQHEDDEAQGIIDHLFGNFFSNISYIDQSNLYTFVSLQPSEKMKFLQNLLLKEYEVPKIKEKLKKEIYETTDRSKAEASRINTLEDILSREKFIEHPKPIKRLKNTKTNLEMSEKNSKKLSKIVKRLETDCGIFLSRTIIQQRLEELIENKEELVQTSSLIEKLQETIDLYLKNKSISELTLKLVDKKKEHGDCVERNLELEQTTSLIEKLQERCCLYLKNKQVAELTLKLVDKKKDHEDCVERNLELEQTTSLIGKIQETIDLYLKNKSLLELTLKLVDKKKEYTDSSEKIHSEIVKLRSKSSFIDEKTFTKIPMYKTAQKIDHRMVELEPTLEGKDDLDNNVLEFENLLTKSKDELKELEQCLECPGCHKMLKMKSSVLILADQNKVKDHSIVEKRKEVIEAEKTLVKLKKEQFTYTKNMEEYNKLFDQYSGYGLEDGLDLDELVKRVELEEKEFLENKRLIKNMEEDSHVKKLSESIKSLEQEIKKHGPLSSGGILSEEEYLQKKIELSTSNTALETLGQLLRKEEKLSIELKTFVVDKDPNPLLKIEREKLIGWEKKIVMYQNNLKSLEKFDRELDEFKKFEKIKKDIEKSKETYERLNERLKGLVRLRDFVKTSESRSVSEFIDSLNLHASVYVDSFFQDEDICVTLKTISELKTGEEKHSLNFLVNYKGTVDCDIGCLSGGERDRVNLAYTLALSELVDSRVLMIDEAISSLDMESSAKVIETLREKYVSDGKLVLLVSHQVETGQFDHVVNF